MAEKRLVKLLLLMMLSEVLIFPTSEAKAWWSRRRRTCSSDRPKGVRWVNKWHGQFSFQCPSNRYSVQQWRSQHRNCKEDRIHYFKCGYGPVPYKYGNCAWTSNYANDFDQMVHFKCSHNGFITGIRSTYSGAHRDRRFGFRCCHVNGYIAHSCTLTRFKNNWDQQLNYKVPPGHFLVGVHSYHHNTYEDRRWKFEICQFGKFNGKKK